MNAKAGPGTIRVADVRAASGARWIGEAFRIYRTRPLTWTGLAFGWLVITFGLLLVPIVGGIAANLLQPAFFASFSLAARRQQNGERVEMGDLFLGFRTNLRALVNVGMVELGAAFVIVLALSFAAGPGSAPAIEPGSTPTAEDISRMLQDKGWFIFAAFVLFAIVKGSLWFAPPLIAFHGLSAMHAIRWSLYAALSNVGSMLVYLFVLCAIYFLAALPWFLGFLLALPVMCLSTYTGYRDVFEREAAPPTPP